MILNPISNLLVQYRAYVGITQKSLVEALAKYNNAFKCLNTVTVSRWETGTTVPSLKKKKMLLHFLFTTKCFVSDSLCHNFLYETYKNLYEPLSSVFVRNYQYLIGNLPEYRTGKHRVENLKSFLHKEEYIEHIIDIEVATNVTNYYSVTPAILRKWCTHPSSFCIIAERKKQHLGHFVMLKLKNHVAKEIAEHKRSEFDLESNDFCDVDEQGTYYVHALYGRSPKIAAELNVRAYLHLLNHMDTVDNVMIFSSRADGVLLTQDYGIEIIDSGEDDEYGFKWYGMLSPVEDILFSDTVVKLIF